jgi:hypothetical protein
LAPRIGLYQKAQAQAAGLQDAMARFSECFDEIGKAADVSRALGAAGVTVRMPKGGSRVAKLVRTFADRVEVDPFEINNRREVSRAVEEYAREAMTAVDEVRKALLEEARGSRGDLEGALRSIGLNRQADALARAAATLDRFEETLPRTQKEIESVTAAGAVKRTTLEELEQPEYGSLMGFMLRTVSVNPPTLADIDPELLGQLQGSGAAANFDVRPRSS